MLTVTIAELPRHEQILKTLHRSAIQDDLDGNALNDLREISRSVIRREQSELVARARRKAVNVSVELVMRKRVDSNIY